MVTLQRGLLLLKVCAMYFVLFHQSLLCMFTDIVDDTSYHTPRTARESSGEYNGIASYVHICWLLSVLVCLSRFSDDYTNFV